MVFLPFIHCHSLRVFSATMVYVAIVHSHPMSAFLASGPFRHSHSLLLRVSQFSL